VHHGCRVFVKQHEGVVGCDPAPRDQHHEQLTLRVTGLRDAIVTFLPPAGASVTMASGGQTWRHPEGGDRITQEKVGGELLIRW